jgi:hypothetical protein
MLNWTEVINVALMSFVPVCAVTTIIFSRAIVTKRLPELYDESELDVALDEMKASYDKKQKRSIPNNIDEGVFDKWLYFGGGFYGLMALITFVVIEVKEIFGFITNFSLSTISGNFSLHQLINAIVDIFVNGIMNLVSAFVWFQYWDEQIDMQNGWYWLVAAYLGYLSGTHLAKRIVVYTQKRTQNP